MPFCLSTNHLVIMTDKNSWTMLYINHQVHPFYLVVFVVIEVVVVHYSCHLAKFKK